MTGSDGQRSEEAELSIGMDGACLQVGVDGPDGVAISRGSIEDLEKRLASAERNSELYGVLVTWPKRPGGAPLRVRQADEAALRRELRLLFQAEGYTKPIVSLLDGVTGGFELGFSLGGTHRVGTATCELVFDGVAAGWLPGPGLIHRLAALPDHIGAYLALTGEAVSPADAVAFGLLTHIAEPADFARIKQSLARAEPIDQVLDALPKLESGGFLSAHRETIRACFCARGLHDIVECLRQVKPKDQAFAEATLHILLSLPLVAAELTLKALRSPMSFADRLKFDLGSLLPAPAMNESIENTVNAVLHQCSTLQLDLPVALGEPGPIF